MSAVVARQPAAETTRVPPHDLNSEMAALGAALLSPTALDDAVGEGLRAEDFYKPGHQHIYSALLALRAKGVRADTVLVADELHARGLLDAAGGMEALHALQNGTPSISNASQYARIVIDKAVCRSALIAAAALTDAAYQESPGALEEARAKVAALQGVGLARHSDRVVTGDALLDVPSVADASLWGSGDRVAWSQGEALLLVGPPGVGKTTLAGQLIAGRMGGVGPVLGFPVKPGRRVLYLAMDRPRQIQRALRRLLCRLDRDLLRDRLAVWQGPLPAMVTADPTTLIRLADHYDADTLVIDSIKDMAIGLSSDEHGAAINNSIQQVLAAGVEVLALHHARKTDDDRAPSKLSDVFGSALITAGAGSVFAMWPGSDNRVKLKHLKQPADDFAVDEISHDPYEGTSVVLKGMVEVVAFVRERGTVTADDLAARLADGGDITDHRRKQARALLRREVDTGRVSRVPGARSGSGGQEPDRYRLPEPERLAV